MESEESAFHSSLFYFLTNKTTHQPDMKYLISILFLLSSSLTLTAQEVSPVSTPAQTDVHPANAAEAVTPQVQTIPATFGYISYSEVMKQMPEYTQAQTSIEKLKIYYDQEMDRAEQEFSKKFSEYIDGFRTFPENIMLKRQKELQQLMDQSMKFKNEAQQLLSKSEKELMAPVENSLKEAIKTVGKQLRLSYVLNTDGNTYPFINTDEGQGIDITNAVLKIVK